ncbi:CU044_2847 family protein [Streptomyces sp. NPDC013455]|uniref:CU044_2847 family protein n=1 Tax=Streptomyces sp. NPDC013455 TaxID=3155605 RepID=UPI0033E4E456
MAIMEFPLHDGGGVLVRVSDERVPSPAITRSGSAPGVIGKAEATFDSLSRAVRAVAQDMAAQMEGLVQRPDVLLVEFGVELNAKAGAVITTAGASAQLKVSLTWNRS